MIHAPSSLPAVSRLPERVGRLLDAARARARRLRLLCGLALTGVVALLAVFTVMIVDSRLVILDDGLRLAMTGVIALCTLLTALFAVLLPLRRRTDRVRMARALDARHPEFEERLSTLVELSETDARAAGFSTSLYELVGRLAAKDVAAVDLKRDFPFRAAARWIAAFGALALVLLGGVAVSPDLVGRLFLRAVAPWMDIGNLFSRDITVSPGDIVALSGSVIRIEAKSARGEPLEIRLSRRTRLGWTEETTEEMTDGVYETTADLNEREWRYRVTAGPAVTSYCHVRVSERPHYERFLATVAYPPYTGLQPLVVSNADVGAIRAIQGTRVKFDIVPGPETVCDFRIGGLSVFEHEMVSNRTTSWSLDLVNADGFRAEMGRHPLTSFIDQPPSVVIEKPTGTLRLPPHAKIPVEITASDDVAVTSVYLRVSIDGEPWTRHYGTHLREPAGESLYRVVADVDLSLYDLISANSIRFDVVAEDGCPVAFGGPHAVTSTPFTVQFNANEANYAIQELRQEVADARRDLDEARRRLNDAQNLAHQVENELRRSEKVSEQTERKSERLAHEVDEAANRLEELRDAFQEDERFAPLAGSMNRLLKDVLEPLREKVENAAFRDRAERAQEVADAMPEMKKASEGVADLMKQLSERAEKVDALEKARDIAARQAALARAASDIVSERPTDTAKLEAWKRLEETTMRQVDDLLRKRPDAAFDEARRKMETAAREMAEFKQECDAARARDARDRQEAERRNRQEADAAARAAQERAAAADQKRAEEALARRDAPAAAQAQQSAQQRLARADALPSVREFQRQAAEAPKETALAAQQAASAALKRESEIHEAMAKGQKKASDLERLDAELRKDLRARQAKARAAGADRTEDTFSASPQAKALESAAVDQTRAEEELRIAAEARARELQQRRAGKTDAANEQARQAESAAREAENAQRAAEANLQKGAATEGVKAMQKAASAAAQAAKGRPRATALAEQARQAQQAAAAALRDERDTREKLARGEATAADLAALDRAFRRRAQELETSVAAQQAKVAADPFERRNRTALGELRAAANSQQQAEQMLKSASGADEKNAERFSAQAASSQRGAEDRLERGGATEGVKALQKRASEATRRARQEPKSREKIEAARAAQQAAREAVARETAVREGIQNGELTTEDLETLNTEMLKKLGAALMTPRETSRAAQAAHEAAAAMQREVAAQAEELGMSPEGSSGEEESGEEGAAPNGKGTDPNEARGGGGVSAEMKALASELRRKDSPDFLKRLFARQGWFKIRDISRTGLRPGDLKDVPREYRDLVRRYFLKLAEEDGK